MGLRVDGALRTLVGSHHRSARQSEGRPFLTINPEFGPPPYQPIDPRTGEPLADIWDVCLWMTQRFRDRWAERLRAHAAQ